MVPPFYYIIEEMCVNMNIYVKGGDSHGDGKQTIGKDKAA